MIDLLKTGNQLVAARGLAGLSQAQVADRVGIHVNTIAKMERRGSSLLTSGFDTVQRVTEVFRAAGVIFIDDGEDHGVGVMLSVPASAIATKKVRRKAVVPSPPRKPRPRRS
jgi:transcriptional regulator with XRE-family HTH domain